MFGAAGGRERQLCLQIWGSGKAVLLHACLASKDVKLDTEASCYLATCMEQAMTLILYWQGHPSYRNDGTNEIIVTHTHIACMLAC